MARKKVEKGVPPFRIGLGSSKAPMTFDEAMGVILDPANAKPRKPLKKGRKGSSKTK